MQEAGSSSRLREVLGQHVLALLRDLVQADDASLQIGDEYPGAAEPLQKRHFKALST
jgi:hypothetical protein